MGICCMAQETQTGALYQLTVLGWEVDGKEVQKGENICIPMADSQKTTKFCKTISL